MESPTMKMMNPITYRAKDILTSKKVGRAPGLCSGRLPIYSNPLRAASHSDF